MTNKEAALISLIMDILKDLTVDGLGGKATFYSKILDDIIRNMPTFTTIEEAREVIGNG